MGLVMRVIGEMIYSMARDVRFVIIVYYILIGVDGSQYDGYYDNGKKHGRGKYRWADGSSYDGDWFENKITGSVFYGILIIG